MINVSIRLRRAILINDLLLVKRILKNTPKSLHNPDLLTSQTSLHLACEKGYLPIVRFLVEECHHEHLGISKNHDGESPLMLAAANGNLDVVEYLCKAFSRCVDWKNVRGLTALHLAARAGHEACVETLIEVGGADVDEVDLHMNTALHLASAYGHIPVIRLLIEHGAEADKRNRQMWLPKDYAYSNRVLQHFEMIVKKTEHDTQEMLLQARTTRAATPVFGCSERTAITVRQRASSGS